MATSRPHLTASSTPITRAVSASRTRPIPPSVVYMVTHVNRAFGKDLAVGDKWYCVSKTWWWKFKSYLNWDEPLPRQPERTLWLQAGANRVPPGHHPPASSSFHEPVDLSSHSEGIAVVPEACWVKLVEWFGLKDPAALPFERTVIRNEKAELEIEVYPYTLNIIKGFAPRRPIQVSRMMLLTDLLEVVKRMLDVPDHRSIRLLDFYQRVSIQQTIGGSLSECGIRNGMTLIVEVSITDGLLHFLAPELRVVPSRVEDVSDLLATDLPLRATRTTGTNTAVATSPPPADPAAVTRQPERTAGYEVPDDEDDPSIKEGSLVRPRECVACMDHEVRTVILPCFHSVLCVTCARRRLQECPVCRKRITEIKRLYT